MGYEVYGIFGMILTLGIWVVLGFVGLIVVCSIYHMGVICGILVANFWDWTRGWRN